MMTIKKRPRFTRNELTDLQSADADLHSTFMDACVHVIKEHGWKDQTTADVFARELYRSLFCKAVVENPMSLSLPPKLDMGWHALLLETEDYISLCAFLTGIPGKLLHHTTKTAKDPIEMKNDRIEKLLDQYRRIYSYEPDKWCWEREKEKKSFHPPSPEEQPLTKRIKDGSDRIRVFLLSNDRKTSFIVYPYTLISTVMEAIENRYDISYDVQRLQYEGRRVFPEETIAHLNVKDGDTFELFISSKGC